MSPRIFRECIQCTHDFYITERDQRFFEARNLELPKRCWKCRQENRREKNAEIARQRQADREQRPNGGLRHQRSPVTLGELVEVFVPDERIPRLGRRRG